MCVVNAAGAFGRVCQATLTDTHTGSQSVVAVKTIQGNKKIKHTRKYNSRTFEAVLKAFVLTIRPLRK